MRQALSKSGLLKNKAVFRSPVFSFHDFWRQGAYSDVQAKPIQSSRFSGYHFVQFPARFPGFNHFGFVPSRKPERLPGRKIKETSCC